MAEGRRTISTHVLDLGRGVPAAGVGVVLVRLEDHREFGPAATDDDGRIGDLLDGDELQAGAYELTFDTRSYAEQAAGGRGFFTRATVRFEVTDSSRSYHVPLLLSPFGMTTYRGS